MKLKLNLLIFGILQVFGSKTSESKYRNADDGNVRYDDSLEDPENLQKLTENIASINKMMLEMSLNIKSLKLSNDWTVILRRHDRSIDFYNSWEDYKKGFGNPNGEFFIGLEKLYKMTTSGAPQELWIISKDNYDRLRYTIYDDFVIGSETEQYALKELGEYRGNNDPMRMIVGQSFATKDKNNNICVDHLRGGWWFKHDSIKFCYWSHTIGPFSVGLSGEVVDWDGVDYSLKSVEMMIRTKP